MLRAGVEECGELGGGAAAEHSDLYEVRTSSGVLTGPLHIMEDFVGGGGAGGAGAGDGGGGEDAAGEVGEVGGADDDGL